MWKTGGPVFPPNRGLVAERASDRKKQMPCNKMQISAVATPNRNEPKDKKEEVMQEASDALSKLQQ